MSYEWVGLGTGEHMTGANIFIMYQDGAGNVTISPRRGIGHVEPQYSAATSSSVELLSGSGVSGGMMVANVRCADCETWSSGGGGGGGGGTLDVAGTGTPWIGAWKTGPSLASSSLSESLSYHDGHSQFQLDLTRAAIDGDSNPFFGSQVAAPGSSGSGVRVQTPNKRVIWAHGLGMAIAFAVMYPLGSALMPLFGKWYIHGGFQVVTWLLMWAAFGLGVFGAHQRDLVSKAVLPTPSLTSQARRWADIQS